MWFTEDPWSPLLILGLVAIVYGIAWNATYRGLYLLVTVGLVGLGGLVFIVEQLIETQSEKVEAQVHALAEAVVKGDASKVVSFISTDAKGLRDDIGSRLENVDIDESLRITDLQVTMDDPGKQANSHFRANGMGTWKKTYAGSFTTRWNLIWKKEGETWRIIEIQQLDPIKGDVINEWQSL